jgi:hypothetical protein
MSLLSYITGTTSQEEQDANLAAAKQRALDRLAADQAAGKVSPARAKAFGDYVNTVQDSSELGAAALGAVEGATEWTNDPGQAWEDTKSGAKTAGAIASDVATQGRKAADGLVWGIIKTFFKAIPVTGWVAIVVALFLWMGGGVWIVKQLKGRLA